jgi:hypothetical protein
MMDDDILAHAIREISSKMSAGPTRLEEMLG